MTTVNHPQHKYGVFYTPQVNKKCRWHLYCGFWLHFSDSSKTIMIPSKWPILWRLLWICTTVILQDLYVGVKHFFALWEECQKPWEQSVH